MYLRSPLVLPAVVMSYDRALAVHIDAAEGSGGARGGEGLAVARRRGEEEREERRAHGGEAT